jgi:hypothetical protein
MCLCVPQSSERACSKQVDCVFTGSLLYELFQMNRLQTVNMLRCWEAVLTLIDDSLPVCVASALRAATPHRAVSVPRMPKLERGGQVNDGSMPESTESPDYSRGYSSSRGKLTSEGVRRQCPM